MQFAYLPAVYFQRPLFARERAEGFYRTTAYVFGLLGANIPFLLLNIFLFSAPFYWLSGLRREAGAHLCVCVACVCACVRACMRARARARVRVRACVSVWCAAGVCTRCILCGRVQWLCAASLHSPDSLSLSQAPSSSISSSCLP